MVSFDFSQPILMKIYWEWKFIPIFQTVGQLNQTDSHRWKSINWSKYEHQEIRCSTTMFVDYNNNALVNRYMYLAIVTDKKRENLDQYRFNRRQSRLRNCFFPHLLRVLNGSIVHVTLCRDPYYTNFYSQVRSFIIYKWIFTWNVDALENRWSKIVKP